uniref:Splicing factor Cactin n=1 Tax=Macrostomum lignano TaxID=282301 RepID=A0A1I8FLY7_9PLAT
KRNQSIISIIATEIAVDRDRDRGIKLETEIVTDKSGRRREDRRERSKASPHADEVEKHKKIETADGSPPAAAAAVRPPAPLFEERRRVKALLKAAETPEQKRARRLAKKAAKSERRRRTFVWHKKLQREGGTMADVERKAAENRAELEKVRERCRQNELEREARLKEQEQEQRDRESENFRQWRGPDRPSHSEGRAKPIDLLGRYAEALQRISGIKIKRDDGADDNDDEFDEDESLAFLDAHSPDALLTGLSVDDLEDLKVDIGVYQKLERQSGLTKAPQDCTGCSSATAAVADRIDAVIQGASRASQLAALEDSVSARICAAGPGTDLAYWEEMLDKVKVAKGKATPAESCIKCCCVGECRDCRKRQSADQGAEVDDPEAGGRGSAAEPEEKTEEIAVKTPRPGGLVRPAEAKEAAGYKFNIFYPDLLDKSRRPATAPSRAKDDPQFAILRFTAGAAL